MAVFSKTKRSVTPNGGRNRSCLCSLTTLPVLLFVMAIVVVWQKQQHISSPTSIPQNNVTRLSPIMGGFANPTSVNGVAATFTNSSGHHQLSIPTQVVASAIICDTIWSTNKSKYKITSSSDLHPACCSRDHCALIEQTTVHLPCCISSWPQPAAEFVYPLLITGTPRSGTVFLGNLLSSWGLKLSNDAHQPRKSGMVSWVHLYKDYYPALPWTVRPPVREGFRFRHIVHQVRDPLASVTSIAFTEPIGSADYIKFISRHIPLTDTVTLFNKKDHRRYDSVRIRRTLEFYVGWNEAILQLKVPRFRLEDFVQSNSTLIADLFVLAGLPAPSAAAIQIELRHQREHPAGMRSPMHQRKKERNKNQRNHRPPLEWEELCDVHVALTRRFLALSQELGYYHDMTSVCDGQ